MPSSGLFSRQNGVFVGRCSEFLSLASDVEAAVLVGSAELPSPQLQRVDTGMSNARMIAKTFFIKISPIILVCTHIL